MEKNDLSLVHLSKWALSIKPEAIPQEVLEHAKKSLVNWLAVTWAGQGTEEGRIFRDDEAPGWVMGTGKAVALGVSKPLSAINAAFINGANAHVLDFDDTHLGTVIHPSAPVLAALLSVIQEDSTVTGLEVLSAFSVACELLIRIGIAVNPKHYDAGWHITASLGGFGGAFAIAKLMNFSLEQTVNAVALAGLGTSGFRSAFGTMGKPYQVGLAASNSVLAAEMARLGADGPSNLLESSRGLVITTDRIDYSAFDGLGELWRFMDNSFKPYPCGVVTHPVIDGGIEIHELGISVEEIDEIVGLVHPLVNELTGIQEPSEGLDGKFSASYLLALAVLDGYVVPAQFSKECIARTDIRNLMKKLKFFDSQEVDRDAAVLNVRLKNGETRTVRIDHASGSIYNPLNWLQIEEKFRRLTTSWGELNQNKVWSLVKDYDSVPQAWILLKIMKELSMY